MNKRRKLAAAMAALAGSALAAAPVVAQTQETGDVDKVAADSLLSGTTVTLRVDGLTCPFCAYGLEKRLREIAAIDTLVVRVSDGLVLIRAKDGEAVTDEDLQEAVKSAGFSLREIYHTERQ